MRISYTKPNENGIRVSRNTFLTPNNEQVQVELDANVAYRVVNVSNNSILVSGDAKSYQTLLKKVKVALLQVGVVLPKETRQRDNKVV